MWNRVETLKMRFTVVCALKNGENLAENGVFPLGRLLPLEQAFQWDLWDLWDSWDSGIVCMSHSSH